jgi:hypothetical protein
MSGMKTPGVYIVEKNAFPNSVVQVATAVPAFIGHTERARNGSQDLINRPFKISSLNEFHAFFGTGPNYIFDLALGTKPVNNESPAMQDDGEGSKDPKPRTTFSVKIGKSREEIWELTPINQNEYILYAAMRLFFQNGGGPCYIVSVGSYSDDITGDGLQAGLATLELEMEPTMIVIPEATSLSRADCIGLQQQVLMHCGKKMKNRFAILDIFAGFRSKNDGDPVAKFRNALGTNQLDYGAAYYPWTKSSIYGPRDFSFVNIAPGKSRENLKVLLIKSADPDGIMSDAAKAALTAEVAAIPTQPGTELVTAVKQALTIEVATPDAASVKLTAAESSDGLELTLKDKGVVSVDPGTGAITFTPDPAFSGAAEFEYQAAKQPDAAAAKAASTAVEDADPGADAPASAAELLTYKEKVKVTVMANPPTAENTDKTLRVITPVYQSIMTAISERMNCMPPAAAMAGIYTMVDGTRGVWKAPANVSLNSVISPTVNLSNLDQEDLNVTPQGKSINAIRSVVGEGVLVWGARTLDGNSLDWRYVNVRRTMIMLEESIRLAAKAYVFEPNVSTTWVTIRSMIDNFLTGIWKQGGLAGAVPADAFSVHVGLGETMTREDILEGILRITVLVAISRPAEFIAISFQQQLQKS